MIGTPGADRAHVERGSGPIEDWLIPPNGRPDGKVIHPDDKIVKPGQRQLTDASYTAQFPMLKVAPGDFVAIQYAENGHVTRADKTNPLKPINRGTVYLYGTTQNDLSETNLVDVHLKWTADGTGGDKKGKLLATRNFDDGQCHEVVPADGDSEGISTYRKNFISKADGLLCQSDLQIPTDIDVGKTLTVIWVWDWPDMNVQGVAVPPASYQANRSDSGQPYVQTPELYTGVVDYKIVDPCNESLGEVKGPTCNNPNGKSAVHFVANQNATSRGIEAQMENPFMVKVPQAGFNVSAATAAASDIPMHALIGVKATAFPLASSILQAQDQPHDGPTTVAPTPSSTPVPKPTSAGIEPGGALIVTVTVPETTTTLVVTRQC
ncbi:hypothetical protein VTK56DRAFT_4659 [Thermocarpiscus australiensis]